MRVVVQILVIIQDCIWGRIGRARSSKSFLPCRPAAHRPRTFAATASARNAEVRT
jgi:hypothetical protein